MVDQQTVEEWREAVDVMEAAMQVHESALEELPDEERGEVAVRLDGMRRELEEIRATINRVEQDLFPRDVLRDLKGL